MRSRYRSPMIAAVFAGLLASSALAVDQPIAGKRLTIRDRPGPARPLVSFTANDAAMLVPTANSDDDPARTAGMRIDLWTQAQPMTRTTIHAQSKDWRSISGRRNLYFYKNSFAGLPVRVMLLTDSGRLRIRMSPFGLFPDGPRGPVAIRVQTGSLRTCTLFDASTIRRDAGGVFVAANSAATRLADCDDATIVAALGDSCGLSPSPECGGACPGGGICAGSFYFNESCTCFAPSQPCGPANAPICNGACPTGEECFPIDGLYYPECQCSQIGVRPCGGGGTACPHGSTCQALTGSVVGMSVTYHRCIDDEAVCGEPAFGKCQRLFDCVAIRPGPEYVCIPCSFTGSC